jgi:thiosulfate dehydrogenase [quinone] large subunit
MAVHQSPRTTGFRFPSLHQATRTTTDATTDADQLAAGGTFTRIAATARILLGFVFLWAFLDKAFGWGYATPSKGAWINGGSPTKGFLSGVAAGPLESTFHSWAGDTWANWLFMFGLLGIGLALTTGIALRLTAAAGTVMMALMWAAEWPPAKVLSDGAPSMSSNPVVDYHLVYAIVMIALAVAAAGRTWGLGKVWQNLPIVRDHRWMA